MNLSTLAKELELDVAECEEIIRLFVDTMASDLNALGRAIRENDALMAQHYSHSIKGASASLGFEEISAVARDVEMEARRSHLETTGEAIHLMRAQMDRLEKSLKS